MTGLKTIIAAAGLALASGAGLAATATAPVAPAVPTAQPTPAAVPNPGTVAAPAVAQPADPTLAADGTQRVKPVAHVGQPSDGWFDIQAQVTKNGEYAKSFHNNILFPLITLISVFVLGLLIYVMWRFREKAHPVPSRTSHNTTIEIVWTLAPVLILVAIAVPSIRLLAAQYAPPPKGAVTLKATGNQWYWSYEYPDNGGVQVTANMLKEQSQVPAGARYRTDADGPRLLAVDNRIVLPVGVPIRLITTAADVIHSWAVPAFWIKLDAVPGRLNETSFTIDKPGLYFGQCSELCGARHAFMPIAVEAVSPAEFAAWIRAKGGTMPVPGAAAGPGAATAAGPGAATASDATLKGTVPTTAGALVNTTAAPAPTTQAATANNGAGGNPGR